MLYRIAYRKRFTKGLMAGLTFDDELPYADRNRLKRMVRDESIGKEIKAIGGSSYVMENVHVVKSMVMPLSA